MEGGGGAEERGQGTFRCFVVNLKIRFIQAIRILTHETFKNKKQKYPEL